MLLVQTYIDCTSHKGVGLFAHQFIPVGTKYWVRDENFDRLFTAEEKAILKLIASQYIEKYGFLEASGNWYLCNDNARFSNHSTAPNSKCHFDENGIVQYYTATKDIQEREEILLDYREVCQTCKDGVDFIPLN